MLEGVACAWGVMRCVLASHLGGRFRIKPIYSLDDPRSHGSPSNALPLIPLRSKHGKVAEIV